jgi:hypothetical protein
VGARDHPNTKFLSHRTDRLGVLVYTPWTQCQPCSNSCPLVALQAQTATTLLWWRRLDHGMHRSDVRCYTDDSCPILARVTQRPCRWIGKLSSGATTMTSSPDLAQFGGRPLLTRPIDSTGQTTTFNKARTVGQYKRQNSRTVYTRPQHALWTCYPPDFAMPWRADR